MFYIYILYSDSSDLFYIGYSRDPYKRLLQHNNPVRSNFSSKHLPWELKAIFETGTSKTVAIQLERFIKKQKSRTLIEKLCNSQFVPNGALARLVRVPHLMGPVPRMRD